MSTNKLRKEFTTDNKVVLSLIIKTPYRTYIEWLEKRLINELDKGLEEPTDIVRYEDPVVDLASFRFNRGVRYVQDRGFLQCTRISEVIKGGKFLVSCGDVWLGLTGTATQILKEEKYNYEIHRVKSKK